MLLVYLIYKEDRSLSWSLYEWCPSHLTLIYALPFCGVLLWFNPGVYFACMLQCLHIIVSCQSLSEAHQHSSASLSKTSCDLRGTRHVWEHLSWGWSRGNFGGQQKVKLECAKSASFLCCFLSHLKGKTIKYPDLLPSFSPLLSA
jgi:hypothetical protein